MDDAHPVQIAVTVNLLQRGDQAVIALYLSLSDAHMGDQVAIFLLLSCVLEARVELPVSVVRGAFEPGLASSYSFSCGPSRTGD